MKLKDIKVKSIDSKSPFIYPSRNIEIHLSEGPIITTPIRASTLSEFNYKGNIPTEITIDNPIDITIKTFNQNNLIDFLNTNQSYSSLNNIIKNYERITRYSPLRSYVIQPTLTPKTIKKGNKIEKIESGIKYLNDNESERERFLRFVIRLQNELNSPLITIPYLGLSFDKYSKTIRKLENDIRKGGKEPMIIFDLSYGNRAEKFGQALSFFTEELNIKMIGLYHKSFSKYAVSYDILSEYVEKDVLFIMLNVNRSDINNDGISTMHYMPFLGNDVYAVKTVKSFSDDNNQKPIDGSKYIKFFNPSNLLIESADKRLESPSKIIREINMGFNKDIQTIIQDFENSKDDNAKLSVFRSLSKIHELKCSTNEFQSFQKRIKSNESTEYIKEKMYLEKSLNLSHRR